MKAPPSEVSQTSRQRGDEESVGTVLSQPVLNRAAQPTPCCLVSDVQAPCLSMKQWTLSDLHVDSDTASFSFALVMHLHSGKSVLKAHRPLIKHDSLWAYASFSRQPFCGINDFIQSSEHRAGIQAVLTLLCTQWWIHIYLVINKLSSNLFVSMINKWHKQLAHPGVSTPIPTLGMIWFAWFG